MIIFSQSCPANCLFLAGHRLVIQPLTSVGFTDMFFSLEIYNMLSHPFMPWLCVEDTNTNSTIFILVYYCLFDVKLVRIHANIIVLDRDMGTIHFSPYFSAAAFP